MDRYALRSERLLLDAPIESDIDDIERYCQDPIFEQFLTIPWPYRRADAVFFVKEFVPKGWATGDEQTWAIRFEEGGQALGVVGIRIPTGNLGFWLGAEHRGQGIMPEAVALVANRMFADGLRELHWECVVGNTASASVARTSGFRFDGSAPATIPSREGKPVESWHGTLRSTDDRSEKPGWPSTA